MVFPTHVGVFPTRDTLNSSFCRLPHARGGVSAAVFRPCACLASSPRTWGCFLRKPKNRTVFRVFPTHVGVFPIISSVSERMRRLPHARGGVSSLEAELAGKGESSPRTWGCFPLFRHNLILRVVFPTHVGVFPTLQGFPSQCGSLPHARGGVSGACWRRLCSWWSSPRTWGCFHKPNAPPTDLSVFPTHVGVFLKFSGKTIPTLRLPHARGGVSDRTYRSPCRKWSSPRTWGCFYSLEARRNRDAVFPTHVGVFLVQCLADKASGGLPHARGGVSKTQDILATNLGASPHMWGSP